MNDITIANATGTLLPVTPRVDVTVRPATMADLPFIDALQKPQTKQVGFMPTKQLEGKIAAGQVILAETTEETGETLNSERKTVNEDGASPVHCLPFTVQRSPCGYLIGQDQYFKRDDVGVIYQINVIPEMRRSLVAATLLKAQFERSAWGCRLYCCWCAQDIEANRFWESMGFVPLAFRAGSAKKARVHIFWQKRIRQGDVTTSWWFPSKTSGGAIGEDRIVLPIPPGVSWRDEMPRVLGEAEDRGSKIEDRKGRSSSARSAILDPRPSATTPRATVQFGPPGAKPSPVGASEQAESSGLARTTEKSKPKSRRVRHKCDPKLATASRELRDRWLEAVNAGRHLPGATNAKYDVTRQVAVTAPAMAAPLASPAINRLAA